MPPMCTSPEVNSSSPAIIRNKVDFPHPDGPTNTVKDPSSTVRSMPWITSSDWKLLWTFFSSSLAIGVDFRDQPVAGLQDVLAAEQNHVTVPLGNLALYRDGAQKSREQKFRHSQFTAFHSEGHGRSLHFDHAPASTGRPKIDAIAGSGRSESDLPGALVERKPAVGI